MPNNYYAVKSMLDYLDGKVDEIEELSRELLPYREKVQSWWHSQHFKSISLQLNHP